MKKIVIALLFLVAVSYSVNIGVSGATLKAEIARYDPFPAEPGKFFTIWMKVENTGADPSIGTEFNLTAQYPLRLINEPINNYGRIGSGSDVLLEYRFDVAEDAPRGLANFDFQYTSGIITTKKEFNITIGERNFSDLRALFVEMEPKAYNGNKATITVDIANTASGTAFYTIAKASTPAGNLERNEIYIGNLIADDFDSIDLKLDVTAEPGEYPILLEFEYKDEHDIIQTTNDTIFIKVISPEDIEKEPEQPPLLLYGVYTIIILAILKYIILPRLRRKK